MTDKSIADIYVRLSEEDRNKHNKSDESESIVNQKKMLTDYCKKQGWEINAIYADDDFSGADSSRPGFNALINDCEKGKCNIVLCKTMSRFSRDMEITEKYINGKFKDWNIRFVSIVDNGDTSVKGNKKSRQINGLINEWYLDDLSENIKATLSAKRKNGEFVGAFAPYGYIKDPENKNRLIIDEFAAEVVKRIFGLYISGFGYSAIARILNSELIPPPCQRKKELGLNYYNGNFEKSHVKKQWSQAAVYTILKRAEYTGAVVGGRQTVVNYKTGKRIKKPDCEWDISKNMHEPIISEETFRKAQKIRLHKGRTQKIPSGERYVLSQKVYCETCGNLMWKTSYEVSGKKQSYLSCKTRKTSALCDNKHQIRTDLLETAVLSELNALLSEYYDKNLTESFLKEYGISEIKNPILSEIAAAEAFIEKAKLKTKRIYSDRLDGIINTDEYLTYKNNFDMQINEKKQLIEILKTKLVKSCDDLYSLDSFFIKKLTSATVDSFIDKIYIGKRKDDKTRKITIYWKI